jgi:hypothetical protein
MYKGKMARLDPYLGQSLKEIVPNADAVLTFVGVSHDILQYDAQFSSLFISWRDIGIGRIRDSGSRSTRPGCGQDGPRTGLVWPGLLSGVAPPIIYHRPQGMMSTEFPR